MQIPVSLLGQNAHTGSDLVSSNFKRKAIVKTEADLKMRRKRMLNAVAPEDPEHPAFGNDSVVFPEIVPAPCRPSPNGLPGRTRVNFCQLLSTPIS